MQSLTMNLFTNTLDTLLIFYFLIKLLGKNHINKRKSILLLLALIIFDALINSIFGRGSFQGFIAIFIVSNIVYSYLVEEKFFKTLIYCILATVVMVIVEIIVISIIILICKIKPSDILETNIYRILGAIGSKSCFYLAIKYLINKLKIPRYFNIKNKRLVILIGFFNIAIIFMTISIYKFIEVESMVEYFYLIAIAFSAILLNLIIYTTITKIIYQDQQEMVWKIKEKEFHKKDFYIKSMNDILETIRSQRHDLGNYLGTLYGLIQLKDFEEAKTYITNINDRISNMNNIIETGHPVITALISMKKNKAFDDDIDIIFDIDLPKELPFDFVDLSIIIGNLLDNAIEACLLIEKGFERKVKLSMIIKDNCLRIESSNTKSQSIKAETKKITERFTTKTDKQNHGFGLGNIEFVVRQYKGSMNIEDLGREFRVNIDLPMDKDVNCEIKSIPYVI